MDLRQLVIDNKLYIWTLKSSANPKTEKYWAGVVDGLVVIDPEIIVSQLDRAKELVKKHKEAWGDILVLSDKLIYKEEIEQICEANEVHYFSYKVPSWVITNFETLYSNIKKMNDLRKFIESDDFMKLTKKERQVKKRQLAKMESVYKWVKNLTKKPDLVIVVDGTFLSKFVDEIVKTGVDGIVLASTDFDKWLDDKLVVMNTNSYVSVPSVLKYLLE